MILLNIGESLRFSDRGITTSQGIAYPQAITNVSAIYASIGSPLKQELSLPEATIQLSVASFFLDISTLVGQSASLLYGEGLIYSQYSLIVSGEISSFNLSQSRDSVELKISPNIPNLNITYTQDTPSTFVAIANQIASDNSIAVDFTDWLAEPGESIAEALITLPTALFRVFTQLAKESFFDLYIEGDPPNLIGLSRNPPDFVRGQPSKTLPVVTSAYNDSWLIQVDPYKEQATILSLDFLEEIRTYSSPSETLSEQGSIERVEVISFLTKENADIFAARYLHRFSPKPIYLDIDLEGVWLPGDQFRCNLNVTNPFSRDFTHVNGDRYQVRTSRFHQEGFTRARCWKVRTDPGTFQPLTPVQIIEKDVPEDLQTPTGLVKYDPLTSSTHLGFMWDVREGFKGSYEIRFRPV